MLTGLINSPATFSRLMQSYLGSENTLIMILYLDDIMEFSSMLKIMLHKLVILFLKLQEYGLKLKQSLIHGKVKCLAIVVFTNR